MNFELTEEQNLIREMVRSFAETEVAPSAAERDEEERFDRALMFDRLAELGLTGIVFPEEYGGAGADYISYAIAVEELSRVCGSTGVTLSAHLSLCANPIYMFGTEEQKQKFLVPLATGEKNRRLRPDRAFCRFRCRWHQDHRQQRGQSVDPQRIQNLHHQRRRG